MYEAVTTFHDMCLLEPAEQRRAMLCADDSGRAIPTGLLDLHSAPFPPRLTREVEFVEARWSLGDPVYNVVLPEPKLESDNYRSLLIIPFFLTENAILCW